MRRFLLILSVAFNTITAYAQDYDLEYRQKIIVFCDKLNNAFNSQDEEYLKDFFEDGKLVFETSIQGDSIKRIRGADNILRTLKRFWTRGKECSFRISEMEIRRDTKRPEFYDVTFRHEWDCMYYHDNGYMFLLFDLRSDEKPIIHVCEWYHGYPINTKDISTLLDDFDL